MRKNIHNIFLIVAGFCSFIISLILYIKSYELYQDSWGTDISFNSDYLIALIISVVITLYGFASLKDKNETSKILLKLFSSSILSLYPLGTFFKALSKGKNFVDYSNYLYIGIIATFFLLSYLFNYLNKKSQEVTE